MVERLNKLVESGLKNNQSVEEIRADLVNKGYLESDIIKTVKEISESLGIKRKTDNIISKLNKKMLLDRASYGFSATQFINILFSMTGASLFFIGMINAIKSSVSTFLSAILTDYSQKARISDSFIRISGLCFGFSFIFLALAVSIRSKWIFALSLLFGSIGIVSYGDSFKNIMIKKLGKTKFIVAVSKLTFIGLLITAISILLSGFLMDFIPVTGKMFYIQITESSKLAYKSFGYLIAFMITAVMSILSAYILAKMNLGSTGDKVLFWDYITFYFEQMKMKILRFTTNKYLFVLTIATLIIAVFQSVLNSFIGIHIYYTYQSEWFGGFVNVAIIYAIALLVSFAGPIIAAKLNKYLGLAPMFVFGSLIMALLPLTIVYHPTAYYPAILVATSLSVLGVAIIGSVQSLFASKLLNDKDRQTYYATSGLVIIPPFLVLVSILLAIAQSTGIVSLFKYLGIGVLVFILPVYFLLVFWTSKKEDFT